MQSIFDPAEYPDLLVGLGMPDDAAVYRMDADRALIFTTDFFTPIVDDPYLFGAIAAANALSDIYAMGGEPLLALNLVAFPTDLPPRILSEVLRGGAEKVREANAVIAGGHTIQDKEPKYGLAVIGLAHPDHLTTKAGAQPGDMLILTKPLGTGTITTAAKRDLADKQDVKEAIQWMTTLNRDAASSAIEAGASAITDITGFGFLGHASEIANASKVSLHIRFEQVPLMTNVKRYAKQWIFPGGSSNNRSAYLEEVQFSDDLTEEERMLLFDAQTSGGLLIALAAEGIELFGAEMAVRGSPWWKIGIVADPSEKAIRVTRQ